MPSNGRIRLILQPLAIALVCVAVAAAVRVWPLHDLGLRLAFITFNPALIIAALYGGLSAGLLATLFSSVALLVWWPIAFGAPIVKDSADWLGLAVFIMTGALISGITEAMRRSRSRAKEAQTDLLHTNAELQAARNTLEAQVTQRTAELVEAKILLEKELTGRKKASERITKQNAVLEGVNRVLEAGLSSETEEELGKTCLKVAEEITGSALAFIGEIGEDGIMHDLAVSDPGWEACAMEDKTGHRRVPGNFPLHGIYGRVIGDGKGLIANDPASHPDSIGVPEGHPMLKSFLGVPLFRDGKTTGIIAVANRDGGYSNAEQKALEALAPAAVEALGRKRAEDSLLKTRDELEARVQERTEELEKARDAVTSERQRLYEILETMPIMVCLLTPDHHVAFANRSFRERFGEDKGRHCFEYCFGKTEPCEFCESYTVLETGKPHHWEVRSPDGSVIDAYDFPFTDTDGSPLILEIDIDITEQRRAQEAIKAERQRLYDVLETLPVYVCLLDSDYRMPFANRYFRETFGESLGRRCHDFLFNLNSPCETCETYKVMKTRAPHHWYWTGPNGSDYDIYDFPFYDADGSLLILEMGIDITERRKAEAALQTASAYNRSLIEASLDPLVTISAEGKITDVNEATERVTGCSRDELIGTDFANYFTDPEKAKAGYRQVFRNGLVTDYELEVRHKDGQLTPVMYNASVYRDESENIRGLFAAARDITEAKRLQNEREKLITELEAKNAELERFTYSVSHDLRSPLITIKTFLGFVANDVAGNDTGNLKSDLERIDKAAEKMGNLLDEILELSRIGRMVNPSSEVPAVDLANEVLELLSGSIAQSGVEVRVAPDLPILYGDRPRLLEVFQNLVENAIKFMGDQPLPKIEIGTRKEGNEAVLYVSDNGIGINPLYRDKVFGLFNQLDQNSEGTGIGLALVKRIVEVHGGRIWVESEGVGHGSTLCFTIPRAAAEE